jgi:antitoxin PrlF
VRAALALKPGDRVVYEIEGDAVVIRKLTPLDAVYLGALQSTLSEWNSPEDAEAYDDL